MTTNNIPLSEFISFSSQFLRSVNIERDFFTKDVNDGYLMTRNAKSAFEQLVKGVDDPSYRALSISGPYGAGKSALAMFIARFLTNKNKNFDKNVYSYLGEISRKLRPDINECYLPILATGTRERLSDCLLNSLKLSLQKSGRQDILKKIVRKKNREPVNEVNTRTVVQMFEDTAKLAVQDGSQGIVVIVDELGKLLEHAALEPEHNDIHLLQELAEAASRSKESPIWFITILHQEFSHYAYRLGRRYQQEWAKIQQRFYDIPCVLDDSDSFHLIAAALNNKDKDVVRNNKYIKQSVKSCKKLCPKGSENNFDEWALSSYPLHPTSLLLLPALFKRYGQGERSLFSFVCASEPYSLHDWMNNRRFQSGDPPFMLLPDLYDYTYHTLIAGRPSPYIARSWTEVEDAVNRLGDGTKLEVAIIKSIGLLGLIGDISHIAASNELLHLALESIGNSINEIDSALKDLENKRLIVFRRFRNAYRLSEGSDIDINELLLEASQLLPMQSLPLTITVARDLCPSLPIVARKHSFQTGMLRSFSVYPCNKDNLVSPQIRRDSFDGYVMQCLVENDEEELKAKTLAQGINEPSMIMVIGKDTDELAEAARDVAALEWVKRNTPTLTGDRIARQELSERRLEAETAFRNEWSRIFNPGNKSFSCFWMGKEFKSYSKREFLGLISKACDAIFPNAPIIKNELINRRTLSTATAAARNNLIEAMINKSDLRGLAIEGYPPERSIYESVLVKSGIHRQSENGKWIFHKPNEIDKGLQAAWEQVLQSVQSEDLKPKPVSEIIYELTAPPFGLANGFIPIFLCACLLDNNTSMAIYEDGNFVQELSHLVFERMNHNPERFAILSYELDGERSLVVQRFAKGFSVEDGILAVIKSLYKRVKALPQYTLDTKEISQEAICSRDAILKAKRPEHLLFVDLPVALGRQPLTASTVDTENIEVFFNSLNQAFAELIQNYPNLLKRIKKGLCIIFDIPETGDWLIRVSNRASILSDSAIDSNLRVFLIRAANANLGADEYLESIGSALVGQPPNRWSKSDEETFSRVIPEFRAKLNAIESTQFLHAALGDGESGYLLTINNQNGESFRRVIHYTEQERAEINRIVQSLNATFAFSNNRILLAAFTESAKNIISGNVE